MTLVASQDSTELPEEPESGSIKLKKIDPAVLASTMARAISSGNLKLCSRLLDEGADANGINPQCLSCTPLINALQHAQPNITQLLVEKGSRNIGKSCARYPPEGWEPVHFAAWYGYGDILQLLLDIDPYYKCNSPVHPVHLAVAKGHVGCLESSLKRTPLSSSIG